MEFSMQPERKRPVMSFTFLELLDRTFRIYRENFITFIGLTALVTIPLTIIQLLLSMAALGGVNDLSTFSNRQTGGASNTVCLSSLILLAVAVLQFVLTQGPIVYIASESQMGHKVSIGEAFGAARPRFGALAWAFIMFYVFLFVFAFAVTLISTALQCAPGLALLGIVAYIGISAYAMLSPVVVLEDVGAAFGVNRAWALGKSRFWTAFGIITAITIIGAVIQLAFTSVAQLVVGGSVSSVSFTTADIVNTAISTIIQIFIVPLLPIALTLLYYDTRTRLEGLDLALQTMDDPDARPRDVGSPGGGAGLTQKDIVNIIILTVGTLVLTFVAGALLASIINTLVPGAGGF